MNDSEKIINIKEVKEYLNKQYFYDGSVARTIKIYNVIPQDLQNKVFDLCFLEYLDYHCNEIEPKITTWETNNKPYVIISAGRSGGYLLLNKKLGKNSYSSFIYDREDLNDLEEQELTEIYKIVKSFNDCVDEIIQHTIHIAKNYEIVEEQIEVTRLETIYRLKEIKEGENEK
jgi:hypothetical protein